MKNEWKSPLFWNTGCVILGAVFQEWSLLIIGVVCGSIAYTYRMRELREDAKNRARF